MKSAKAVPEFKCVDARQGQICGAAWSWRRRARRDGVRHWQRGRRQRIDALQLPAQAAALRQQFDTRKCPQRRHLLVEHQVGTQRENLATHARRCRPRPHHPHRIVDGILQILNIRRLALVQDNKIERQIPRLQKLEGPQRIGHKTDIARIIDAHDHDRQIARYAMHP